MGVDSAGRVYVGHRGENPILVFDPDGALIRMMGNDLIPRRTGFVYEPEPGESGVVEFCDPDADPEAGRMVVTRGSWRFLHGIHIDSDDHLWVTDVGSHTVLRFDPDGVLVLTLGTPGEAGLDRTHFNQPTDVTIGPQGEVFVTDGYVNSRVVKFSPTGEFLHSWGTRGSGPGEFNTPHAITTGPGGVLYVSDRTNFRIQLFDHNGHYLGEWTDLDIHGPDDGEINDLAWGPDGNLYLGNGRGHRITVLDATGHPIGGWGGPEMFRVIHGITFDHRGHLYVAEVKGHRVRQFASPL